MTTKVSLAVAAVLLLVPVLIATGVSGAISAVFGSSDLDCTVDGTTSPAGVAGFGTDQVANAAVIVAVGHQMQVPRQGQIVALVAAIQESGLSNLDYGDRDSLGLFQQRPSQGWGSPAQIMDPAYAATQFYRHMLAIPGWQQMTVNDAAQAVQGSATPTAYGAHQQAALDILATVEGAHCTPGETGGDCAAIQAPNPVALAAINFACGQRGIPYLWGGNGAELTHLPNGQTQVTGGFDCSGLTKAAYAAADIQLPRTAQAQYDVGPHVPAGQVILPGDLVFFGSSPSTVTHVGIAISAESMIDAPDVGQVVKTEQISRTTFVGATRPAGIKP